MILGDECPRHGFYEGATCLACEIASDSTLGVIGPATEHYTLPPGGNYAGLQIVLDKAFEQAAFGKGAERHATGLAFEEQPMQKQIELFGIGFSLGQASKKMHESQRMDTEAAVRELLGAINYIAGTIIHLEKRNG